MVFGEKMEKDKKIKNKKSHIDFVACLYKLWKYDVGHCL